MQSLLTLGHISDIHQKERQDKVQGHWQGTFFNSSQHLFLLLQLERTTVVWFMEATSVGEDVYGLCYVYVYNTHIPACQNVE